MKKENTNRRTGMKENYKIFLLLAVITISLAGFSLINHPAVAKHGPGKNEGSVQRRMREASSFERDTNMSIVLTSLDRDEKNVYLTWVVRNQSVGGFYVIERFLPGHYDEARYIHFIPSGAVNGTKDILYSFIDRDPLSEVSSYRVWYIEDNGSYVKGDVFTANEFEDGKKCPIAKN
ncbi:MAG TPA: hypothetical protein VI112_02445 [Bacteroidia bacterium]|jgi:hypothetical protein